MLPTWLQCGSVESKSGSNTSSIDTRRLADGLQIAIAKLLPQMISKDRLRVQHVGTGCDFMRQDFVFLEELLKHTALLVTTAQAKSVCDFSGTSLGKLSRAGQCGLRRASLALQPEALVRARPRKHNKKGEPCMPFVDFTDETWTDILKLAYYKCDGPKVQ